MKFEFFDSNHAQNNLAFEHAICCSLPLEKFISTKKKMKLNRKKIRTIRRLTQQECIDEIHSTFDDEEPGQDTVYQWYKEFNRGRTSLAVESRECCLKTTVTLKTLILYAFIF